MPDSSHGGNSYPGGTIRCKFRINTVSASRWSSETEEILATPVMDSSEGTENNRFWKATPNGSLLLYVDNPDAQGFFKPGDEIYVDLSLATQEQRTHQTA